MKLLYIKLNQILLIASFTAGLGFSSCDEIDGPYREVPPGGTDTTQVTRKVLLEEYTGHKCGFCPGGAEIAHNLKSYYGDKLIIMSIHAGNFATVVPNSAYPFHYDFRTPAGNQMVQEYAVETAGYPSATINRVNHRVYGKTEWAGIIDTLLQQPAKSKLEIVYALTAATRTLQITVKTKFLEATTVPQNLSLYLIETDLENWQKDYRITIGPTDVPDYVHKDFLRAALTPTWGEPLTTDQVAAGTEISKRYTYVVPANYDLAKCKLVATVNNSASSNMTQSYVVSQAEETDFLQ